jgi:hypothetical protein
MPLSEGSEQMNTIGSWMRFSSNQSFVIAMAETACSNGDKKTEPLFF